MTRSVVLASVALFAIPLTAQSRQEPLQLGDLRLSVAELRAIEPLTTARGPVVPRAGMRLVQATLLGLATAEGVLVTTPREFAGRYSGNAFTLTARAFAVLGRDPDRPNWVLASPDSVGPTILNAIVRPGAVRIVVVFEVPEGATSISVSIPSVLSGATSLQDDSE